MSDKRRNQAERILQLFEDFAGTGDEWVSAISLSRFSLSYTRRIFELRQRGFEIEMREERSAGQRHTAYRLVRPDKKAVA